MGTSTTGSSAAERGLQGCAAAQHQAALTVDKQSFSSPAISLSRAPLYPFICFFLFSRAPTGALGVNARACNACTEAI